MIASFPQPPVVSDATLVGLAKRIARHAVRSWNGFLQAFEDEVESEALVSVTVMLERKPEAIKGPLWRRGAERYAYGLLIASLRSQRYLPSSQKNGAFVNQMTNMM